MRVVILLLLGLIVHATSAWPLPDVAHATMRLSASRRGAGTVPLVRNKRFITTSHSDRRGQRLVTFPDSRDPVPFGTQQLKPGSSVKDSGGSAEAMVNNLLREHTLRGQVDLRDDDQVPVVSHGGSVDEMISDLLREHMQGPVNFQDDGEVSQKALGGSAEVMISNPLRKRTQPGQVDLRDDDEIPVKPISQGGSVEALIRNLLRGSPRRGMRYSTSDEDTPADAPASILGEVQGDANDIAVKRFIGLEPGSPSNPEMDPQTSPELDDHQTAAGLISRLMSGRRESVIHQPKQVASLQGVAGASADRSDDHPKDALNLSTLESLLEKILAIKMANNAANLNV
ncbi:uncharacterized protein [Asterias amurensis]|uniref:uncharacterized protein n=1 Tax=Asterias amurensis TaxID=7602 RepID=UPI003AB4856C